MDPVRRNLVAGDSGSCVLLLGHRLTREVGAVASKLQGDNAEKERPQRARKYGNSQSPNTSQARQKMQNRVNPVTFPPVMTLIATSN